MNPVQTEYARQEALKADPLRAPLMLLTVSLESGLQLLIDGNHGVVKLCINGVWHQKTYADFLESFVAAPPRRT